MFRRRRKRISSILPMEQPKQSLPAPVKLVILAALLALVVLASRFLGV